MRAHTGHNTVVLGAGRPSHCQCVRQGGRVLPGPGSSPSQGMPAAATTIGKAAGSRSKPIGDSEQ